MKRFIVVGLLLVCVACGTDNKTSDPEQSGPKIPRTQVKIITEETQAADSVYYEEVEINGRRCFEAFYDTPSISCDPPTTTTTLGYR